MTRRSSEFRILDKDLDRISNAEMAQMQAARPMLAIGAALIFVAAVVLLAIGLYGGRPDLAMIAATMAVAAYLALSIGSNDVANALGPAVGAGAVPLVTGLMILGLAEICGALLAGGAVSHRIAAGIITPQAAAAAPGTAQQIMLSALLAAAIWISFASWRGLPVSTTHSIIGAIAGAGLVTLGPDALNWSSTVWIATAWVAAPVLAAMIAAAMLALIRHLVNDAPDRTAAARRWLPGLIGAMTALFVLYLGLLVLNLPSLPVLVAALLGAGLVWYWGIARLDQELARQSGEKLALKRLFSMPLLWAAALMGFAHGANDAANVAGPLTVILGGARLSGQTEGMPMIALLAAGTGIALGTVLFGGRLVRMVGSDITRLNPVRAFCVSCGTAATVLTASAIGLPVSTTHIAVGAVFGIGFFREWHDRRRRKDRDALPAAEYRRRLLVRRTHLVSILAAWMVTVPVVAALAAAIRLATATLIGG